MSNRIGEACWYRESSRRNWQAGVLRMWSTDHVEYSEDGPGLFPAAVVEDDETGMCHSVYVNNVCFAANKPHEKSDPR